MVDRLFLQLKYSLNLSCLQLDCVQVTRCGSDKGFRLHDGSCYELGVPAKLS